MQAKKVRMEIVVRMLAFFRLAVKYVKIIFLCSSMFRVDIDGFHSRHVG